MDSGVSQNMTLGQIVKGVIRINTTLNFEASDFVFSFIGMENFQYGHLRNKRDVGTFRKEEIEYEDHIFLNQENFGWVLVIP